MTHQQVAEATTHLDPSYSIADISDEEWREVITRGADGAGFGGQLGGVYRINNPVTLIIRKGGSTHRVVDMDGVVHCYVAPESGNSILRWKVMEGKSPVLF